MNKFVFFLAAVLAFSSCKKDVNEVDKVLLADIVSLSDYDTQIQSGVSLMFFHATWCSICKAQTPAVEATAKDAALNAVKFGQIDTDNQKAIVDKYDVPGQPIILIYKDGVEKHRLGSGQTQQKLTELLKALL
jgi:thioredoxin 1